MIEAVGAVVGVSFIAGVSVYSISAVGEDVGTTMSDAEESHAEVKIDKTRIWSWSVLFMIFHYHSRPTRCLVESFYITACSCKLSSLIRNDDTFNLNRIKPSCMDSIIRTGIVDRAQLAPF